MEPRNIGIILWSTEGIAARFLKEKVDRPGEVDGRSIPAWIESFGVYKQWIKFWRKEIDKEILHPYDGGIAVSKDDPRFLDVLKTSGRGNFMLVDGGVLLEDLKENDLASAVDYLYDLLIATPDDEEARDETLKDMIDRIVSETHLKTNRNFKPRYHVKCAVAGTVTDFEFNYAYGNGHPRRLYHRASLASRQADTYVHNAAFMFEKVIAADVIKQEEGAVLVYANERDLEKRSVRDAISILGGITRVLNLADIEQVTREFSNLSNISLDHHEEPNL